MNPDRERSTKRGAAPNRTRTSPCAQLDLQYLDFDDENAAVGALVQAILVGQLSAYAFAELPNGNSAIVYVDGIGDPQKQMSPSILRLVLKLAEMVANDQLHAGGPRRLAVQKGWRVPGLPDDSSAHLHCEARALDLIVQKPAGSGWDTDTTPAVVESLGCLCFSAGFRFAHVNADSTVHVSDMHRLLRLWRLISKTERGRLSFLLNADSEPGWFNFMNQWVAELARPLFPATGLPILNFDTVPFGQMFTPIPVAPVTGAETEFLLGEFLIETAFNNTTFPLVPKARTNLTGTPLPATIEFEPLPSGRAIADTLKPATVEGLEMSLQPYSVFDNDVLDTDQIGDDLKIPRSDGIPVPAFIKHLVDTDDNDPLSGRYQGLQIHVHRVIDVQLINFGKTAGQTLPGRSCLTDILDQFGLQLDAIWFWTGPLRIEILPKPQMQSDGDCHCPPKLLRPDSMPIE